MLTFTTKWLASGLGTALAVVTGLALPGELGSSLARAQPTHARAAPLSAEWAPCPGAIKDPFQGQPPRWARLPHRLGQLKDPFWGQSPPPPGARGRGRLRQRVAKMVQQFRMMKIIGAINLSSAQAPRFFAVLNQFENQIKVPMQTIQSVHQLFRRMVTTGSYNARKINRMTDQLLKAQIKIKQLEYQRYLALKKILTAEQLAKLVLALPQIERQIRRFIRRARYGSGKRMVDPFRP